MYDQTQSRESWVSMHLSLYMIGGRGEFYILIQKPVPWLGFLFSSVPMAFAQLAYPLENLLKKTFSLRTNISLYTSRILESV